jgi:anhydro-N-acetylmuramic acid kinase
MNNEKYAVVGMMSGTSMDGMDLVLCRFSRNKKEWHFHIEKAVTYDYTPEWTTNLNEAFRLSAGEFLLLHNAYGRLIGDHVTQFLKENNLSADLVASHGHTIFHQPEKLFTYQLGEGASIVSRCNVTTVSDFRTMDVALGGQGAPLVPIGDELLFSQYGYCLNLGGFANVSNRHEGKRIAFDICPVNIVLNELSRRKGKEYDKGGQIGRSGIPHPQLVEELNSLEYYLQTAPKSLGREWVEKSYLPLLDKFNLPLENIMSSVYEHISQQIGSYLDHSGPGEVLVTGGGAFNNFLIEKIQSQTKSNLVIPDEQLVKFKEALIFAFLGLLRFLNETNCLSSVTGAMRDSSSGIIHLSSQN